MRTNSDEQNETIKNIVTNGSMSLVMLFSMLILLPAEVYAVNPGVLHGMVDCGEALRPVVKTPAKAENPGHKPAEQVKGSHNKFSLPSGPVRLTKGEPGAAEPVYDVETTIKLAKLYSEELTYTARGLLGSFFPRTDEIISTFENNGGLFWGTRGTLISGSFAQGIKDPEFVKAAVDHAKANLRDIQDHYAIGFYLLGDEAELGVAPSKAGTKISIDIVKKIFRRGLLEVVCFSEDGKKLTEPRTRFINGEEFLSRLNFNMDDQNIPRFVEKNPQSHGRNIVSIPGWFTGRYPGVIDHNKFLRSNVFSNAIATLQDLSVYGIKVVFNPRNPRIVQQARDLIPRTQRYKTVNGELAAMPVDLNRHLKDPKTLDDLFVSYNQGNGYLAVLVDADDKVVGGEIGTIHGMSGETVFYDEEYAKVLGFKRFRESAEMAMVAVVQVGLKYKQRYSKSGLMISKYSDETGAESASHRRADELMAQNEKLVPFSLPDNLELNPFDPYGFVDLTQLSPETQAHALQHKAELASQNRVEHYKSDLLATLQKVAKRLPIGTNSFVGNRPLPHPMLEKLIFNFNLAQQKRAQETGSQDHLKRQILLQPGELNILLVPSFESARLWALEHPEQATSTLFIADELLMTNQKLTGIGQLSRADEILRLLNVVLDKARIAARLKASQEAAETKPLGLQAFSFKNIEGLNGSAKGLPQINWRSVVKVYEPTEIHAVLKLDMNTAFDMQNSGRLQNGFYQIVMPGWQIQR